MLLPLTWLYVRSDCALGDAARSVRSVDPPFVERLCSLRRKASDVEMDFAAGIRGDSR